jgi:phage baseplate assembly protein W
MTMPDDTSTTSRRRSFLGSGWAFPVALDATGGVALVDGVEDVRQSIRIILGTDLGERIRMDFGSSINAFVFEPISTTTLTLLRARVEEALVRWEPRIRVGRVDASLPDRSAGRVDVSIDYRVRETNTFYNLVYPFYLEEGEGSWR